LLDKYKDEQFPNNLALPVISNQRMNDSVKELGKLCGIYKSITITYYKGNARIEEVYKKYELLGTHSGRRTFICNAITLGIPPQVVMKWTGHSDYKSMKPYIDIADKTKEDAMSLFNKNSP
jgi:integrase